MDKKYELRCKKHIKDDVTKTKHTLYRIRALRDVGSVKAGEYGGYIESEDNLSHDNVCWIFDDAWVGEHAKVSGNAVVCGTAKIYNNAMMYGNAYISENAHIFGSAHVFGSTYIHGDARICESARVSGRCELFGDTKISGDAQISTCSICSNNIKLDHSIWNQLAKIDDKWYIISSTLQKILLGNNTHDE